MAPVRVEVELSWNFFWPKKVSKCFNFGNKVFFSMQVAATKRNYGDADIGQIQTKLENRHLTSRSLSLSLALYACLYEHTHTLSLSLFLLCKYFFFFSLSLSVPNILADFISSHRALIFVSLTHFTSVPFSLSLSLPFLLVATELKRGHYREC